MGFKKVKSGLSRTGKVQDTYKDGRNTLVVCGDRGALVNSSGVKKVLVAIDGSVVTVKQEMSSFLPAGNMVQDWLNGGQ